MAATGIKEVRPTHEAILDHVLTRPHGTLRELGQLTGYSVSWLSQVMRSDCFRAAYDARRGDIEAEVMMGIGDRLNALSHLAIDKIEAELLKNDDPDFKIDAFDKILHRTGYAPSSKATAQPGGPQVVVQNNFTLSREDLATFRSRVIEGTTHPLAERIQDESEQEEARSGREEVPRQAIPSPEALSVTVPSGSS